MNRTIRGLLLVGLLLLATSLRLYKITTLMPYIDDLGSRLAIVTLEIHNGIYHFPYCPYLFEYDESGSAYVAYLWTLIFGTRWISFQVYAGIVGVILVLCGTLFAYARFGLLAASISGILLATNPALLTWDRYPTYASNHILTILTLASWSIIPWKSMDKPLPLRWVMSGFVAGLGLYLTNLSNMAVLAVMICIVFGRHEDSFILHIKRIVSRLLLFCTGMIVAASPLLLFWSQFRRYLLWRKKHFEMFIEYADYIGWMIHEITHLITQLVYDAGDCLFQTKGFPLLGPMTTICAIAGFSALFSHRKRSEYYAIPALFLIWSVLIASVATGIWRCSYFSLIVPFLLIHAGVGGSWLLTLGTALFKRKTYQHVFIGLGMLCVLGYGIRDAMSFIHGPQKPTPGNSLLTRLHYDLEDAPDIPHLFTLGVHEAYHYHFPFWFAVRSNVTRASIIGWDSNGWYTHPDRIRIAMNPSQEVSCRIVVDRLELDEFKRVAHELIAGQPVYLERSGLWSIPCAVTIPEEVKRTWTDSVIPIILDIKSE